jgi:hypothetical protein
MAFTLMELRPQVYKAGLVRQMKHIPDGERCHERE